MKLLRKLFLALFTMAGAIALFACGDAGLKLKNVTCSGLNDAYNAWDTIDFSNITVNVEYSDGSSDIFNSESGSYEIDLVNIENAQEETKCIIYTNGLYEQTPGDMQTGAYNIEYYIIGYSETKTLWKTITVGGQDALYDIDKFDAPQFIEDWNKIQITTEEASFYSKDTTYQVGDDNEFIVKPEFTLSDTTTGDPVDNVNIRTVAEVRDSANELVGEAVYTYNPQTFGFDFTSEAIGNTYEIKVIAQDYEVATPITFTVEVQDGWNVNTALDLGVVNINNLKTTEESGDAYADYAGHYAKYRNDGYAIFYGIDADQGMQAAGYYAKSNNYIWRNFLKSKGYTDEQFDSIGRGINGLFLHGNINVTDADIPSEFFVSKAETDANTSDAVGSLRDYANIYQHMMSTGKDFNFNGNCFTLNLSDISLVRSKYHHADDASAYAGRLEIFPNQNPEYFPVRTTAFFFSGLKDFSTTEEVQIKNLSTIGNTQGKIDAESTKYSGGLIFMKTSKSIVKVENNISKNFLISWYGETISTIDLNHVKTYDDFNSAIFSWGNESDRTVENDKLGGITVANSEFKRFGGPVALLTSSIKKGNVAANYYKAKNYSSITFDDATTTFDNPIAGNEAWFALFPTAQGAVTKLMNLDYVYNNYGAAIRNNGKVDLIVLTMDEAYFGESAAVKYAYSDVNFLNTKVGEQQIDEETTEDVLGDVTFKGYGPNSPAACNYNNWTSGALPAPVDFGTLGPAIIETSTQVNGANLSTFYTQRDVNGLEADEKLYNLMDIMLFDANITNYQAFLTAYSNKQQLTKDSTRSTTNKLTGKYTHISTHADSVPMGIVLKLYELPAQQA